MLIAAAGLAVLVAAVATLVAGYDTPRDGGRLATDDRIVGEAVEIPSAPPRADPSGSPLPTRDGTEQPAEGSRPGERWSTEVPDGAALRSRVVAGTVVTLGVGGTVTGRSAVDGLPRWHAEVPQRPDRAADEVWAWYREGQADTPVQLPDPVAGTVVVRRGEHLAFLDVTTGERLGEVRMPISGTHLASSGPWVLTSDGERIAAVGIPGVVAWDRAVPDAHRVDLHAHGAYLSGEGDVARLVANTGEERWRSEVGATARVLEPTSPTGDVLVALDGAEPALVALDPSEGTERWRVPVEGSVTEVAIGEDRLLVAVTGPGDHRVEILAPDDQDRFVARRRLVLDTDRIVQLELVGRQVVAVTGGRDTEVVLATDDGFVRHRFPTDGQAHVVAADGRTLLVADDRGITAVALVTGQQRFEVPLTGARLAAGSETVFGGADALVAVGPAPAPPRRGPCPRPGPGCAP